MRFVDIELVAEIGPLRICDGGQHAGLVGGGGIVVVMLGTQLHVRMRVDHRRHVGVQLVIGIVHHRLAVARAEQHGEAAGPEGRLDFLGLDAVRGQALFADPSLGTSGKSCNTCHTDLGRGEKSLVGKKPFDHTIRDCIQGPLQGDPGQERAVADLMAYIASLK